MSETEELTSTEETATKVAKKPVRRTRKAVAKDAAVEESTETSASAEMAAAKKPAAKKTRTTKAKAASAVEGTSADDTKASEAGSEEPAKKPVRRTRVKKAEAAEGTEAAEATEAKKESAEAEAGAKKPTRHPRVKRASGEGGEVAAGESTDRATAKVDGKVAGGEEVEEPAADKLAKGEEAAEDKADKQKSDKKNNRHNRQKRNNQSREVAPSVTKEELEELKLTELRAKADELEIDHAGMKKPELVDAVYDATMKAEGFIEVEGILDILQDGYGFLRTQGYLPSETDCYMGTALIRRNNLRKGDMVRGQTRPARPNEKYAAIQKIISVNGVPVEELGRRIKFGDLTPVYPDDCLVMEHGKNTITARVIDLVSPIGKGQRGLIVSPPKAGKTTILKDIAASISANNPEVHLMCLLVDERPEEVTDMQRSIKGEVISSTFDMPTENHIQVAELVIERAKRLVENGKDVVILLDSLTRLARAYNLAQPASGRILSGGVDSTALYPPKKFLGAARNIEGGGSLTILASALVETGSKMDEVIFEEFKGTGNMELKLDRSLADRRIFPAIDPVASGTRKEDLLLDPQEAPLIWAVRRILANTNNTERAMDMLIKSLKQTDTNQEFLIRTAKKAQHSSGQNVTEF